jgi:hypothetical protein
MIKMKYVLSISPTIKKKKKKTGRVGGWLGHMTTQLQTHRISSIKWHWYMMMKSK